MRSLRLVSAVCDALIVAAPAAGPALRARTERAKVRVLHGSQYSDGLLVIQEELAASHILSLAAALPRLPRTASDALTASLSWGGLWRIADNPPKADYERFTAGIAAAPALGP
jgi:hypothetical protein